MALERKRKRGQDPTPQKKQRIPTVFQTNEDDGSIHSDDDEPMPSGSSVGDEEEDETEDNAEAMLVETSKPSGSAIKRPPTALELRDIKDATDLYRSSSFKLQIDALLPNTRPKYQNSAPLDRFLESLHTCFNSLPSISPRHPLEAAKALLKQSVAVPYVLPLPGQDTNWKVGFEKPSEIVLAGSWANKLAVKGTDKQRYTVDLGVEIPSSLLQEKDYLNGRFFQKRAYFLSVLAAAIMDKKSGLHSEAVFSSPSGDSRLTCLVVRPKTGSNNDLTKLNVDVRIIPTLSASSPIPLHRLSPTKANIRTTASSEDASQDAPSPVYNNAIHVATTPKLQLLRSHTLKGLVSAYSDALTLLRIWANQRGYGRGSRLGIRGFESTGSLWTAVLDLLISGEDAGFRKSAKRKPLGKGVSSYQLFRAALDLLASHDFTQDHIRVRAETGHSFSPDDYPANNPVFVDATGVNVLSSVPSGSLDMLRYDARVTLDALNEDFTAQDPFKDAFLKDHREFQTRFDVVLRVDLSSAKLRTPSVQSTIEHGSLYNALLASLLSKLRQGLGDRAKAVVCLHSACEDRALTETDPAHSPVIYIGLILDIENAFRLVDHGPRADDPDPEAATRFRDFWGEKAELRRFKDGSIVESVVWDVKTSDERTKIPYFVAVHILAHHFSISDTDIQHWQDPFDATLRLPESITSIYQVAKAETGFKAAMAAFDGLVKSLKAVDEELPLGVLNVSPASEMLRYTNVFTPIAVPPSTPSLPECAQYLQPMEIVLEFEKSGRWPDDLRAIQKVKLALLERVASKLMESTPELRATVVVGDPVSTSDIMDTASLEIITPQGWAFTARIWHDREAKLLDTTIDDRPHIPAHIKRKLPGGPDPKSRQAALEAKELYVRRFIHAPRHHRAIAALCHRYTAYAGTVRLIKRWLASNWVLQKYLSVEAVELLSAVVFLGSARKASSSSQPPPIGVPGTKERGFAKVIELLAEWEWDKGIFIPLYGDEQTEADEVQKGSLDISGRDGVWKISTEFDPEGFVWTRDAPDAVMARRIQKIATATWKCLQNLESGDTPVMTMFWHPEQQYDFLIGLNAELLPRYYQNIRADPSVWDRKGKYANIGSTRETRSSPVQPGYDPAQLLFDDLSRIYKDTFLLFRDPLGGDRFGGVWEPRLKEPRPFKILGKFSATPVPKDSGKDKSQVMLNKEAILSEVERFGAGLITSITQRI
ncbi:hypothetical protein EIP91_000780 [Steccherinum ochraceum]|uniref:U3 small nucleolar RNA-associated protein 22 n=1 Tax=Steccherinum ochraceum TaxID=92696 RepID=A0A4R0RIG1_9APHY|nr:hypothetical protein EIP91_000780 [Steccherinum ochraceum]